MKERLIDAVVYGVLFAVILCFALLVDFFRNSNKETVLEAFLDRFHIARPVPLKKKHSTWSIIFSIPVIILPCLFAGLRADTVGTDVKLYAKDLFDAMAFAHSVNGAIKLEADFEIGYKLLAYAARSLSPNLGMFLFLTELVIFLPIYIAVYRRSPRIPVTCSVMVYLLLFYCATFNIMRQSIAAAFLILAYQMYEEKKYSWVVVCVIVALLFHNSTIVGAVLYILSIRLGRSKKYTYNLMAIGTTALMLLIAFSLWSAIAQFLLEKGIIPERYETYLAVFSGRHVGLRGYFFQLGIDNYFEFLFRMGFSVLLLVYGTWMLKKNENTMVYWFGYLLSFLVYALVFVMMHSSYGMRIAWFTEFMLILALPELIASSLKKRDLFSLRNIIVAGWSILYFGGYIVFGWHGIFPLRFSV